MDNKNKFDGIDALLSRAVNESFDREMASIPSDEELARMFPYSEESLKRAERRLKAKRRWTAVAKYLKRVAVVFVAISALSITVLLTGNAMKHQGSVSLPETDKPQDSDSLHIPTVGPDTAPPAESNVTEGTAASPTDTSPPYFENSDPSGITFDIPGIDYIPEGYELQGITIDQHHDMTTINHDYNHEDKNIAVTVVHNPAPKSNPSGLVTERITFNGIFATLTYDYTAGVISINYYIDNNSDFFEITVKGPLDSRDELIKIAENMN